jgi:hypothetical protein
MSQASSFRRATLEVDENSADLTSDQRPVFGLNYQAGQLSFTA